MRCTLLTVTLCVGDRRKKSWRDPSPLVVSLYSIYVIRHDHRWFQVRQSRKTCWVVHCVPRHILFFEFTSRGHVERRISFLVATVAQFLMQSCDHQKFRIFKFTLYCKYRFRSCWEIVRISCIKKKIYIQLLLILLLFKNNLSRGLCFWRRRYWSLGGCYLYWSLTFDWSSDAGNVVY